MPRESGEVILLNKHPTYLAGLASRWSTYSLAQLNEHAKWWRTRDEEVWLELTTYIARRKYGA